MKSSVRTSLSSLSDALSNRVRRSAGTWSSASGERPGADGSGSTDGGGTGEQAPRHAVRMMAANSGMRWLIALWTGESAPRFRGCA